MADEKDQETVAAEAQRVPAPRAVDDRQANLAYSGALGEANPRPQLPVGEGIRRPEGCGQLAEPVPEPRCHDEHRRQSCAGPSAAPQSAPPATSPPPPTLRRPGWPSRAAPRPPRRARELPQRAGAAARAAKGLAARAGRAPEARAGISGAVDLDGWPEAVGVTPRRYGAARLLFV